MSATTRRGRGSYRIVRGNDVYDIRALGNVNGQRWQISKNGTEIAIVDLLRNAKLYINYGSYDER